MKVTREFTPVTIVLETQQELEHFAQIIHDYSLSMKVGPYELACEPSALYFANQLYEKIRFL